MPMKRGSDISEPYDKDTKDNKEPQGQGQGAQNGPGTISPLLCVHSLPGYTHVP